MLGTSGSISLRLEGTTLYKALLSGGLTLTAFGLWKLVSFIVRIYTSPLRILPGPTNKSWIYGNLEEIRKADVSEMHEKWAEEYGKILVYKAFFCRDRLFTMDLKAINHIFTHSMDYQKPAEARFNLTRLLGDGILVTEGEKHRQQRRIMNPSFGPSSIKDVTPIFFKKSLQLRDIWKSQFEGNLNSEQKIEVLSWLSRTTLDVIGLAGFDYHLDALSINQEPNELNKAFSILFNAEGNFNFLFVLQAFFPIFRMIPTKRENEEKKAHKTMLRIGEHLITSRKKAVIGEIDSAGEKDTSELRGRDLLSALVRSNMDTVLPDSQRMSDEDVLAQVPTFLVAGHETTSTETMWALYALSQHQDIQKRLREECLSVPTDTPSYDELNGLPFLDAVVRETLRLHAAVPSTIRIATKDDLIPVNEPYKDKYGNIHNGIKVRKGDGVLVPLLALNRSKAIWGEDATVFNPDRWSQIPEAAKDIPGVWGNIMTFLGGARSCIGYRFALAEMKALLFTLLRDFEFEPAVSPDQITKRSMIVTRPYLKDDKTKSQMPLMVRIHKT